MTQAILALKMSSRPASCSGWPCNEGDLQVSGIPEVQPQFCRMARMPQHRTGPTPSRLSPGMEQTTIVHRQCGLFFEPVYVIPAQYLLVT